MAWSYLSHGANYVFPLHRGAGSRASHYPYARWLEHSKNQPKEPAPVAQRAGHRGNGLCVLCFFADAVGGSNIDTTHSTTIHDRPIGILLRESVGIRRWSAIILGFIGMLMVVRPGADMLASGSLYMLTAAFLIGCTTIIIRHLGKIDDPVCITFYFTVTGVAVSTVGIFIQGWQQPPVLDLALLIMVGLFGGMAQYLMTVSYQHLAVGVVAPLKYLTIVFGGSIAYLVWDEVPDLQSVFGISIIILSGLYTLHRELVRGVRTRA